jgi:hypothetical protein
MSLPIITFVENYSNEFIITGSGFGTGGTGTGPSYPTAIAGTSVTVNGIALGLKNVTPTQIVGTHLSQLDGSSSLDVRVSTNDGSSDTVIAPGFISYRITSFSDAITGQPITSTMPGDHIQINGSFSSILSCVVTIGGVPAIVTYSSLDFLQVIVPVAVPNGAVPVFATLGGQTTQGGVTLLIQSSTPAPGADFTAGRLAALDITSPAFDTELYAVPSQKMASVSVSIVNRTANDVQIRLALTASTFIAPREYVAYDETIPGHEVYERSGLVLTAGQHVYVRSSATGVTAVVYGYEESL